MGKRDRVLSDGEIDFQIEYVLKHNNLPLAVVLKPLCQSVAQAQDKLSFKAGQADIVEWIEEHALKQRALLGNNRILLAVDWEDKLKEWGLDKRKGVIR